MGSYTCLLLSECVFCDLRHLSLLSLITWHVHGRAPNTAIWDKQNLVAAAGCTALCWPVPPVPACDEDLVYGDANMGRREGRGLQTHPRLFSWWPSVDLKSFGKMSLASCSCLKATALGKAKLLENAFPVTLFLSRTASSFLAEESGRSTNEQRSNWKEIFSIHVICVSLWEWKFGELEWLIFFLVSYSFPLSDHERLHAVAPLGISTDGVIWERWR